jgi:hypothetical protein
MAAIDDLEGCGCFLVVVLFGLGVSGVVYSIMLIAGAVPYDHPKWIAPITFVFGLICLLSIYLLVRDRKKGS